MALMPGGTTFNVGADATVTIDSGTFTGGCVFNVATGAVVDLTGGGNPSYSGTLTGSGSGTVELTSGRLSIGVGGLTFDFPGTCSSGSAARGCLCSVVRSGTRPTLGP